MAVLNDFGDAGVARVEQVLQAFAGKLGVDKEYVYAFFNHTGHLPQTLDEFQTFLNDPNNNPYHVQRRDPNTGALTAIRPGVTPGKSATDPGFNHRITNAEDSAVERFQQVDPNGNIWGGSFDPAYNAAHPELAGRSGSDTAQMMMDAAGGRGPTMRTQSMTPNGERSVDQMRQELANAGYNGPQDDASITDAYNRTSGAAQNGGSGGGGGSAGGGGQGGGFGPLLDAAGRLSSADFGLRDNADKRAQRDQDFNQQNARDTRYDRNRNSDLDRWQQGDQFDQSLYSNLAQNLLKSSVELGAQPRDYFKLNQMQSGGRDIFQQLFGDQPRTESGGFTGGEPESGNISDVLGKLGVTAMPHSQMPNLPFQAPNTDYRQQAQNATGQLKSAYQGLIKQLGVPYLSWDDPRLLKVYQDVTGLDETGARRVSQAASDYSRDVGGVIPDNLLSQHIADAYSGGTNTNPGMNRAQNVNSAYGNASNAAGQWLGPQDPRTTNIVGNLGGLNPAQAGAAAQAGHDWAGASGYAPTATDTMGMIERARRGQGQPMQYQMGTPQPRRQASQFAMA